MEELRRLAARVESPLELVKPLNKKEVEGKGGEEILRYLAANPNSVRRPIIDKDGELTLGFTSATRARLEGG